MEVASLQEKLAKQALQHEEDVNILRDQLASKDDEIEGLKMLNSQELKKTLKPYLQPTKSTLQKQTPKKNASSPTPPSSIRDPQGKLLVDSSLDGASYMQPTKATLSREGRLPPPSSDDELDSEHWGPGLTTAYAFNLARDENNCIDRDMDLEDSISPHGNNRVNNRRYCHCRFCEDVRYGRDFRVVEEIQDRTRYHDNFFQKPNSHIFIPFTHQLRLLRSAMSIGQHAFYHGLEKYWPGQEMYCFPLGPESIHFGRSELQQSLIDMAGFSVTFRTYLYPELKLRYTDLCTNMPTTIRPTLENMVGVRNALAHPSSWTSSMVDEMLKCVHDLACMVRGEVRAHEVRALRDELRELVEQAFNELARLEPWVHLPNDILWPVHHEETFRHTLTCLEYGKPNPRRVADDAQESYYDPAVARAAKHWADQHTILGLDFWQVKNNNLSHEHDEHLSNWLRFQKRMQENESRDSRWRSRIELEIDMQKMCERPLLM